jgi:predicted dehydrogenase
MEIDTVSCRLQTFEKAAGNQIEDYVLDANDSFAMTVQFHNGAIGVVHASRWASGHMNDLHLRLYGDKGGLEVMHNPEGSRLRACVADDVLTGLWRDIECRPVETNYQRFVEAVQMGRTVEPSFRHAAELQKILDISMAADIVHRDREIE